MMQLAAEHAAQVLDVLSGRLTFERTGVKLYDSVIQKIERSGEARYQALVDQLKHNRDEEKEHEEWLEQCIRDLGGYPDETTAMSKLESEESQGIASVILDGHTRVIDLLHALLAAELSDNAGWDLLVKLADDVGDRAAKLQFAKRLAQEAQHLAFIREAVVRAAEIEVLGQDKSMPSSTVSAMARPIGKGITLGLVAAGLLGAAGFFLGRRFA